MTRECSADERDIFIGGDRYIRSAATGTIERVIAEPQCVPSEQLRKPVRSPKTERSAPK